MSNHKIKTDDEQEDWKDIPGSEGMYQSSTLGRIKSLPRVMTRIDGTDYTVRGRILRPYACKDSGRLTVTLWNCGERRVLHVHRLVLEAFVGPCPDGMECRHLDGDASNNRLDNLLWGTHQKNEQDKKRHGTYYLSRPKGERHSKAKLSEDDVREIRRLYDSGERTQSELAEMYGVKYPSIYLIRKRINWSHVA